MTFDEKLELIETILNQDFENWVLVVLKKKDEVAGTDETIKTRHSSHFIAKMLLEEGLNAMDAGEMEWVDWEEETLDGDEWKNEDN